MYFASMTYIEYHKTRAITSGALTWYFNRPGPACISRCHYGIMINKPFSLEDPEHTDRIYYTGFDGMRYVKGGWGLVLAQVLLSLF
jgi:hypothetical protein